MKTTTKKLVRQVEAYFPSIDNKERKHKNEEGEEAGQPKLTFLCREDHNQQRSVIKRNRRTGGSASKVGILDNKKKIDLSSVATKWHLRFLKKSLESKKTTQKGLGEV